MNIHIREDMNEQEKCAICHERNCNTITDCEHYFHSSCLEQWIIQRPNCPVCRTTINLESNEVELNLNSNINESESDDDETDMNSIRIDITNMMNVLLQEQIFFSRRENNRIRELNITTFEDNILTHNENLNLREQNLNLREQNLNLMTRLNNQQTEAGENISTNEVNILRERVRILEEDINNLKNLSKDQSDLSHIYGELVGISKISLFTYQLVYQWAQNNMNIAKKIHYEEALVNICETTKIFVEKIEDLIWAEIDTKAQYKSASNYIYQKYPRPEHCCLTTIFFHYFVKYLFQS